MARSLPLQRAACNLGRPIKLLPAKNMRTVGTLVISLPLVVVAASCASTGSAEGPPTDPPAAAPVAAPSDETAIFSQAQAERGRATFRAICAECHYSSEFRGTQFQFSWRRRSVADFFEEISSTMPEDAPGGLEPAQYLDVVAYVLELNGFPAGEGDLPLDLEALETHSMAAPPAGAARAR